ncbi:multiple C2 domain and transmembrane region protein isoform X2 [Calliopsis andreniformis]|uniref:multiple C2 domain and transmembrane region protein isoform X2 n=1 Tax=Calliopsis andreniformis TaxID=337506 RepID=UPI003FCCEF56
MNPQKNSKRTPIFEEKRRILTKFLEERRSKFSEVMHSESSLSESSENQGSVDSSIESLVTSKPMFKKRNKVSDIIAKEPSIDIENHPSTLPSRSYAMSSEDTVEKKWKRFWDTHRERYKYKFEERTKNRSQDDTVAEVVFRKAIRQMQFDDTGDQSSVPSAELADTASEKSSDKNNDLEEVEPSNNAVDIEAPPRRAKLEAARRKECKLSEVLAADQDTVEKKSDGNNTDILYNVEKEKSTLKSSSEASESNFFVSLSNEEKNGLTRTIRSDPSSRKWSSLENLRTKVENSHEKSSARRIEGLSIEKPVRNKEKRTIGTLKASLEKKMGSMERIFEDQVEKIWEEKVEKHPWLLPIETWIVDHCKSFSSQTAIQDRNDVITKNEKSKSDEHEGKQSHVEQNFDFKFSSAGREDEEPKIESRLEYLKKSRRAGSPKLEKVGFDAVQFISRLKKSEQTSSKTEDTSSIKSDGVLEVKEVKHHDLFDKLKDNVREKMEDIHRYFQRTNRLADVNRRLKSQIWSSVVTIVLVEAKNLLPMDIDGLSDPYVKFRLGTEKYKSKVVHKTLNPVWLEQFDLHLYEDPYLGQELEVTVWDRDKSHQDDLMGRTVIDLAILERETTHRLWRDLEDGSGNIFLLLTISGTTASETISDLAAHEETPREREQLYHRYSLLNTLQRVRDVGHLTVKVFRAQGLAAADLGGKSDPFCVLELVNARLQTQTEYKTLAPNWQKIFTFNVKDINSVLEVTVYDEDRDHKVEFLGKVAVPLLRIRNGEKRWYALKDKKLRGRAKGNSPQILLEMTVVWNVFRACVRTLNPKEKKYMEPEIKFKRQVFLRNVLRLKAIIIIFIDIGKYVQSCWEWESKMRSVIALVLFILGCYYFEPYMIPGAALLILLKYYLVAVITGTPLSHHSNSHFHDEGDDGPTTPGDDDDDEDDKDKEEKKSLKERLQAIQEVTQTVQNSIGYIASLCERVKNLFNFTVPYLSYLAIILTILAATVLYFIPVRYLILAWGVNKFARKIFRPHSVPNNELLDLVSRVPDDEELLNYRELKPLPTADCEKGGASGSPGQSTLTRREQRKRHKA